MLHLCIGLKINQFLHLIIPLILQNIKKDIHIRDVLLDMENALKLDPNSPEYLELKNKIINVGEFNIQSL